MKVLKFGGTSVANAQNIKLVLEIVEQKSKQDKLIVAVSAFSGVTDLLLSAAQKASTKDDSYRDVVLQIEKKHLEAIKELVPVNEQTALLHYCKKNISYLETLLDGCYLLGELTLRTSDMIVSFGELLSSYIIAEALKQKVGNSNFKDSRELIKTNSNFGKAEVNFEITNVIIHY